MDDIFNNYTEWLLDKINDKDDIVSNYTFLLSSLNDIPFTYILDMDENRESDGSDLRYRFIYENEDTIRKRDAKAMADDLGSSTCSMLEMMIALSIRCEENIMYDPNIGSQIPRWFWDMISSLGLIDMTDEQYDEEYVAFVVKRFLDRDYEPDGSGGLFYIPDCSYDLRDVEIWTQLCWYLDKIIWKD